MHRLHGALPQKVDEMSKVIKSPVDRFAGTITISDPLTLPQVVAVQEALREADELKAADPNASQAKYNLSLLPGILACVEKVDIPGMENVTPETWPGSPYQSSAKLVAWLIGEIIDLFREAEAPVPNV